MHIEPLEFVTVTPYTGYLITSSIDGVVKMWKKVFADIVQTRVFKVHDGEITSATVSADGQNYATAGVDKLIKIFDVINMDVSAMITLDATPRCICWVHKKEAWLPLLAVSVEGSSDIRIYDGRGGNPEPLHIVKHVHRKTVTAMAYNNAYDCVVSADESGMVEYWQPSGTFDKPSTVFKMKSSTSLFEFKKAKSVPTGITLSPDGSRFACFSFPDRKVRIFDFASGKLYRCYDESIATITDMQQAGTAVQKLEEVEFGRRLAVERDLDTSASRNRINVIFDESGHFILYGSILGVKAINTLTNNMVRCYGAEEPFRALNIAMYQGQPEKKSLITVEMATSENPLLQEAEQQDAMLAVTAPSKVRFYLFNNNSKYGYTYDASHGLPNTNWVISYDKKTRDVQNEKPRELNVKKEVKEEKKRETATSAVIHTTYGDIHLRLFPEAAPKAVENFVVHSKNGYYNNVIFHRVIPKFMIQTGDPHGDGTGGESIWGREFEDEFSSLKHDKPYTVSMANAGPGTNGSQFFITTEKASWLDNKHTIFGRAIQGLDVVHQIEKTRIHKEKPVVDIKIINIEVS